MLSNYNFLKDNKIFLLFLLALIPFILLFVYNFNFFQNFDLILSLVLFFIISFIILLIYKVSKQIYSVFFQVKHKVAGNELHQRLALLFSGISLMPAIIISVFSILTLNTALDGWFNKKISTAVSQSVKVANHYLTEHQNAMRGEILKFANQLNINAIKFSSKQKVINNFLNFYVAKNNLTDAVLLNSAGNVLAYSKYAFEINYSDIPEKFFKKADKKEIILTKDQDTNKMKAFIKLDQYVDAYLLISRFVDKKVLDAIKNTSIAVNDYQLIELNKFDIKISFFALFLLISLLLLLLSLYLGLKLSNRLVSPIGELIFAAEEVGRGNLNFKISNESLLKNKVEELKRLGNAFNQMIHDIKNNRAELINANEQLDKRRQFSEAVLSGVYSGVIGLDRNLNVNLPNFTSKKLLGISIEKHFGKSLVKILPEFKPLLNKIKKVSNDFVEDRIELIRKDKKLILIARAVKQSKENKIIGYVITFEDVTDLINAQKLAAWSDVARKIAHEIKNPLTPIKLGAERLRKFNKLLAEDKSKHDQTVSMILKQVEDIKHLIDEFSSFSRMPSPKLKKINLFLFIKQYLESFEVSYQKVSLIFRNIKKQNIYILADEKQLRQVLGNLFKNSYESFVDPKKSNSFIEIEIKNNELYVIISVKDNGSGIKKEIKDKILEPYYTTKVNGTGLGLAISKKIIEDHNGTIHLNSEVDEGTCVKIKFPLSK